MSAINFKITPAADGHMIITGESSNINLHVRLVQARMIRINRDELQFYGMAGTRIILFETEAWNDQQLEDITAAIKWYAVAIDRPDMEISIDPNKFDLTII